MKKKIINGLLFAVALVAATSSFVSCKDYEGDNYAELNEKYTALQAAYLAQVSAMQDYVLTSRYNSETGYSAAELAAKGTIKARLDDLEEYQESLENDSFPKYAKLIHENNLAIAKAQGLAERDSAYLRSLLAGWDNGGTLGDMVAEAAGLLTALKSDTAKYNFAYDTLSTYYKQWNEAVKVADSAWNFVNKGKVNVLGKDIENLQEMATLYDSAIADLHERIDSLCDEMDAIKETIKKEVTGIEIQATINPIYGTFAYPFDLQSNVLATYYGEVDATVFFPAADGEDADFWVGSVPAVLASELKDIKAPGFGGPAALKLNKGIVMDETEGNAGTLYVTVNPSNVDFTGKEFSLRSSDNKISKVVLSDLVATDDVLTWGARRASANGFYKATATISKDVVKDVALSFKFDALKTEVKGILDNFTSISAREAAVDVAKLGLAVMNAMPTNVPRLGVQAQWKDDLTGWKNYVSKYELAAVSAKPLGYDFLYNVSYADKVVKLQNALIAKEKAYSQELINQIASAISIEIGYPADGGAITVTTDADGKKHVKLTVNSTSTTPATFKQTITVAGTDYVIDFSNQDITGTATADITTLFEAIQKAVNTTGIKNTVETNVNKVLNKIINVENKIFGKVASFAGNPNRFILPAMLASNESLGYFYPSRNWFSPTLVKAGETIKLYPTSLTGEVVAPAFKKYVAILTGPTAGKNYNTGDLNTVLEGGKYNLNQPIEITLTEKGVYEFIYEALGYNGKISGKKYYIEVY